MSKPPKIDIKYIIVHDDGTNKEEFIELFGGTWGIISANATANAIHYLMRDNPPAEKNSGIVIPDRHPIIPDMFPKPARSEP